MDSIWLEFLHQEQQKEYFIKLTEFLKKEYEEKTIFPKETDIYNALKFTPFKDVKVVILGQDPYHDIDQAHGLAFSVKRGMRIPPSLRNIFTELLDDLAVLPSIHGDLTEWAKQCVLLLNTVLTVEAHKAHSHKNKGWETFTDNIIKKLNEDDSPKVFVLWGNHAISKKTFVTNPKHLVLESVHPSPLSAHRGFFGSKPFSKINAFMKAHNKEEIDFTLTC